MERFLAEISVDEAALPPEAATFAPEEALRFDPDNIKLLVSLITTEFGWLRDSGIFLDTLTPID